MKDYVLRTENVTKRFGNFHVLQDVSIEIERGQIYGLIGQNGAGKTTLKTDTFWVANRHIPLKEKEKSLDELLLRFRAVPIVNAGMKIVEIFGTDYIKTADDRTKSKFDIGLVNSFFTSNDLEGVRLRAGGMTTANLHAHLFASGYTAYGFKDEKWKYYACLTYSLTKKRYFEGEYPVNNLSLTHEYDVYTPGQDFLHTSKDNIVLMLWSGEKVTKMTNVQKTALQYEKEWLNGLSVKTWGLHQRVTPAGELFFIPNDGLLPISHKNLTTSEAGIQLRFAPSELAYGGRAGKESVLNLAKDAPVFKLSYQMGIKGVFGSEYNYHCTELSAEKRMWLSSFGHIDVQAKGGKVWSKVLFPLLILPNTNQSITIQPESFHLMRQLEFVADQYVALNATYYMKGLLFNRIPGIKRLGLRKMVSFSGICGHLSSMNNPAYGDGLFLFPQSSTALGNKPYMEGSIGVENIFKCTRMDYYRRLSYRSEPDIQKGGFRIGVRLAF